ncbi:MAG: ribose-5-phosphate isomerase RpiA [Candidatus Hydrothermarchaeota archaeon]
MHAKKLLAKEALKYIKDGDVVGIGTGSTVAEFIVALGKEVRNGLDVIGIPTSYQSMLLAIENNIKVASLNEYECDIAIDGADQVNSDLILIKGGGGAHTLEKIVDYSARRFIVIVEERKMVEKFSHPIPVEVIPKALRVVEEELKKIGNPSLRWKENRPFITDFGNFICDLEVKDLDKPKELEIELNSIPGVVENGIFTCPVERVLVGSKEGVKIVKK